MLRQSCRCAAAAVAVGLLASSEAVAARPTARIVYTRAAGAAECPDETALREQVAERLGYDPFARRAVDRILIAIGKDDGVFHGALRYEDGSGRALGARDLDAADCAALVETLALTVVILLDPPVASARSQKEPPANTEPAPVVTPIAAETPKPAPAAGPTTRLAPRVGAGILGSLNTLPSAGFGAYSFLGARMSRFSIDVESRIDFPSSDASAGVRASRIVGTAAPCLHYGIAAACVAFSFGGFLGEALRPGEPRRGTTFYAAIGPRLALEVPLAPALALQPRVDVEFPVTPTTLRQGGIERWNTPPVGASGSVGVVGTFW
jgi:hypothetical protein